MASSLVATALGADFGGLHPALRERHGFDSSAGVYSVGTGVMERVWHGSPLFAPFLHIGAVRHIMFPESGTDVPFRIECWAYRDRFGRETLSLNRSFELRKPRRFDEYVVSVPGAGSLIIYCGSHQHLAAEIRIERSARGGIVFTTGAQRLLPKRLSIRFPRLLSASARVEEWYDEKASRFRIDARVRNRLLGDVLGCTGSFDAKLEPIPASGVPAKIRPVVEQARW